MTYTMPALMILLSSFVWTMARITGLFLIMPIFGVKTIPPRIRIALIILLTSVVFPTVKYFPEIELFSLTSGLVIAEQLLIGFAIGFIMKIVFEIVTLAGQLMAQQSGLGFAMLIDPQSGINVPLISQLYLMLCSIVFLSFDGHLAMIQLLSASFDHFPIGKFEFGREQLWAIIQWCKILFVGGVSISLPVIIALLIVYTSLGIMNKAAPQLNVFSIGFSITLIFGMFLFVILMPFVVQHITNYINQGFALLSDVMLRS